MIHLRPASLAAINAAAWLADKALTRLAPSVPRHVLEAENRDLRERIAELEAQREYLLNELAQYNETPEDAWVSLVEALPDITPAPDAVIYTPPAERTIVHPSPIGPLCDRFADDLAGVETVGDLLWAMGGDE